MRRNRCGFSVWLLVVSAAFGLWPSFARAQTLDFTGYVRSYAGVLWQADGPYAGVRNTLDLGLAHRRSRVGFAANPYLWHQAAGFAETDDDLELGLRQAYMDVYFDALDVRLGKQQIIWGKADGMFITDVVSPKDLREFLLPDFEEIRVGVTALKLNYYRGDQSFEAVWVPVFTPTRKPEPESIWFAAPDFPVQPQFDRSQEAVARTVSNSEVFARYSLLGSAFDLELVAGYAWDDDPALHLTRTVDPATRQLTALTVTPQHHRVTLAGGSFSAIVGGVVVRGEGAYSGGKYFSSTDPRHVDGVVAKDSAQYLLGLERSIGGVNVSAQFMQQVILDYDDGLASDQVTSTATLLLSKTFLRETLRLEVFTYVGLNDRDALIRPKVTYDLADGFEVQAGANIFVGETGMFGQYDDNDMLYVSGRYSF